MPPDLDCVKSRLSEFILASVVSQYPSDHGHEFRDDMSRIRALGSLKPHRIDGHKLCRCSSPRYGLERKGGYGIFNHAHHLSVIKNDVAYSEGVCLLAAGIFESRYSPEHLESESPRRQLRAFEIIRKMKSS
ncbi:hypothetical protein TNCV_3104871 [Trichonephila clavipes]|nr:hypothetical protein TNCV_3104871 [Trichonephila clavipes]